MDNKIIKLNNISKMLFLIFVFNCKNEIKDVKLINKIDNNDSIFDNLSSNRIKKDNLIFKKDTLIWYNIYDYKTKKIKEKVQYQFFKNEGPRINQFKFFDSQSRIVVHKSHYLDIIIDDTLSIGANSFSIDFIGNNLTNRTLLGAGVENSYNNLKKVDSFLGDKKTNNIKLTYLATSEGKANVKGFVIQQALKRSNINDTLNKLFFRKNIIYYSKPVYIKGDGTD